ncbi:Protein FAR1-RELATED SEQUENCE 5 [Senna tora]|uniref:Protein FAR1-RELATED SEQUENCE 5 n=1 Tax=Senna tora TaxID=362788 RepID=A0A834TLB1_9FABA|nr:Protein FAR1-RELATED SEQUENCE 5 [Senna tora]
MMDHQSGQGFDSNKSNFDLQEEISEKNKKVDELSQNMEFCDGEDEQSVADILANAETSEPFVGMEFNSRDEAREFYIAYGRRIGFTVRIHHNRRSRVNNQVIGQDFVCSKEGFRAKKYVYRKDRVLPPPPVTREGCQAMVRLALRDGGRWVVTKFVKEHTHKLMSPSKVPWRGSGKHLVSEICLTPGRNGLSSSVTSSWLAMNLPTSLPGVPRLATIITVIYPSSQDEKDKRIRELSLELYNERQKCKRRCAAYEEQLNMILNDLEKHTEHISKKVADIVESIREIEEEKSGSDVNPPVPIGVHLHYHPLAILGGSPLLQPQRRQHRSQLVDGDEPVAVLVEHVERLLHVLLLVALVHQRLVQLPELLHVHALVAVHVDLVDHLLQILVRDEDPHVLQGVVELLLRDPPVPVAIKHLEYALDLNGVH